MDTLLQAALSNAALACVLALPAAAVARLGRWPALAHALWLLVLLKLITPPLIAIPIAWPQSEFAAGDRDLAQIEPQDDQLNAAAQPGDDPVGAAPLPDMVKVPVALADQVPDPSASAHFGIKSGPPWGMVLMAVWLTVSALWLLGTILQVRRFRRLLRHARLAPVEVQEAARALAARFGRSHPPAVWLVPGAISPMLWALGRAPRLLFPVGLLDGLAANQRDALLAHELAHWRRRDHWVRLVELVAFGLYWWHPLLWWARHELHEAEEQCCDAWAVWALDGDGRTYALALLQTLTFLSHAQPALPVGASGVGQVRHLRRRLKMVMRGNARRSLSWFAAAAVFGLGLSMLPVGAQDKPAPTPTAPVAQDKRDQDIRILREALRVLEAQRAAKDRGRLLEARGAAEQARAEFAQAKARYEATAAALEEAQAALQLAKAELRKAAGRLAMLGIPPADALATKPSEKGKEAPSAYRPGPKTRPSADPSPAPSTKRPELRDSAAKALLEAVRDRHSDSLEQRLERLLREVEQLRLEIRGQGQDQRGNRLERLNRPNSSLPRGK